MPWALRERPSENKSCHYACLLKTQLPIDISILTQSNLWYLNFGKKLELSDNL